MPSVVSIVCLLADALAGGGLPSDELRNMEDSWKARATRFESADIHWRRDADDFGAWSTYQTAWGADRNGTATEYDHSLALRGEEFVFRQPRWYYLPHREFGGFNALPSSSEPSGWLRRRGTEDTMTDFLRALDAGIPEALEFRQPALYTLAVREGICREWWHFQDGRPDEGRLFSPDAAAAFYAAALFPSLHCFRPRHAEFPIIELDAATVVSREEQIGGRACLKLQDRADNRTVWIDPEAEFVVRRLRIRHEAAGALQVDFDYRKQQELGWVPSEWTVLLAPPASLEREFGGRRELRQFARFKVKDVTTENVSYSAEASEFPSDTLVIDDISQTRFRQRSGSRRENLTAREWTELAMEFNRERSIWRQWPGRMSLVVLAAVAGFVVTRRLRRKRVASPSE